MPSYYFDFSGIGLFHKEEERNTDLTTDSRTVHRNRHHTLRSFIVLRLRDNRHTCEQGPTPGIIPPHSRAFIHLLLITGKRSLRGHPKPLGLTISQTQLHYPYRLAPFSAGSPCPLPVTQTSPFHVL
jgi:hypothetical protein